MFDQTPIPQTLMILKFPDLNTLRIALTTGAVPGAVSQTAVVAGFDDQDQLWVDTSATFPRPAQTELRRLGVQFPKSRDRKSTRLNSSHANISYAVFCLKKKKKKH